jgi:D-alanine-D-alanine ligase
MDPDKYEAVPIGITKEGHWLIGAGAQKMLPGVFKGGQRGMMTADPADAVLVRASTAAAGGQSRRRFPVMHGTFGEDGTIRAAGSGGIAICRRGRAGLRHHGKDVAKRHQVAKIPVVPWITVHAGSGSAIRLGFERRLKKFKYPCS